MAASGIWIYAAFFTAFFSALIFFSWFETLALRFLISCLSEITFFFGGVVFLRQESSPCWNGCPSERSS